VTDARREAVEEEVGKLATAIRVAWKKRCHDDYVPGGSRMGGQSYYIEELEYFDEVATEMILAWHDAKVRALREALAKCVASLEYVDDHHMEVTGAWVRHERIATARALLTPTPGAGEEECSGCHICQPSKGPTP